MMKPWKLDQDLARAWEGKGFALYSLDRSVEAAIAYDSALKINPDSARTWIGKGLVHLKLGKYKRALETCSRAISIKPDSPEAWHCKGLALSGLEKDEDALGALERALRLNPSYIEARKARNAVNSKLGFDLEEDEVERKAGVKIEEDKPAPPRMNVWARKKPTSEIMQKKLGPGQGAKRREYSEERKGQRKQSTQRKKK